MATNKEDHSMLPVPNPTPSYWQSQPHRLDSHRSTPELPETTDIVIIGAGIAGVSVAYHLATHHTHGNNNANNSNNNHNACPPSTLLLEARQTCSGATGRNGGHVKTKTDTLLRALARHGPAASDRLAAFVTAHVYALKAAIERERLPSCEFELRRSYDVFLSDADAAAIGRALGEVLPGGGGGGGGGSGHGDGDDGDDGDGGGGSEGGGRVRWARDRSWLGPDLAERITGVRGARGAVSSAVCSFWPYKFVTGLLARAMERNPRLNLQTETPVLAVEDLAGNHPNSNNNNNNNNNNDDDDGEDGASDHYPILVRTDRGTVRAKKVIFATNAYAAALLPQYRGVIVPYKGTAAHLAPPSAAAAGRPGPVYPHLGHTYNIDYGVDDELETVDYLNPRPDGGVVVGGAKWLYEARRELWYDTVDDATLLGPVMEAGYFEGYMQRNFRGWEDSGAVAEKVWTGIMGLTPDGFPHVGEVPGKQNQYILAGFNGGGNAHAYLCAKGVAKMALEDIPLSQTGVGIPELFETTEERLGLHPDSRLDITLDVRC